MGNFSILACGKNHNVSIELEKVYQNLSEKINNYEEKIFKCINMEEDEFVLYAPYIGRALLETVCTAILGRIDPFRILFVDKVQNSSDYKEEERTENAILWTGDIIQRDPINEKNKMWDQKISFDTKVKRALLGDYYNELFWKKAFQNVLDEDITLYQADFIDVEYRNMPIESFIPQLKSKLSKIYSVLSKVVHGEMLRARVNEDVFTVRENIVKLLENLALLLFVANYIDVIQLKLEKNEIIESYINLKERIEEYGGI